MKWSLSRRRKLGLILAIAFAFIGLPYGWSRIASPWRRVSIHTSSADLPLESSDPRSLRVACYNIAHGRGIAVSNWDGGTSDQRGKRLDQIANLIRGFDADVVVLNEVDFDSSWSFSINQARYLAEKAGFPFWVEERNLDFRVLTKKWRFGNALLSKHPIMDAQVVDFPNYSSVETWLAGKKRGIECVVDVHGQPIRVIAAHLSHRSEAIRVRSVDVIRQITESDQLPTLVAGDLNSAPTGFPESQQDPALGNAVDALDTSLQFQRYPEVPPKNPNEQTFHSTKPEQIIDWVLIPKDWKFSNYHVELSTLSDHRPVVADLVMPPELGQSKRGLTEMDEPQ